jgi:transposase
MFVMTCSRKNKKRPTKKTVIPIGTTARNADVTLRGFQIGALPLLNHFLQRLELDELLRRFLPKDDVRQEIPTSRVLLLLVRNVLVSRQPMYAVPQWAAQYAPEAFDLYHADIPLLHDDRLGKCLARLYTATTPDFILAVVRKAIEEFGVTLDELHNDSTSISFHGQYPTAAEPVPSSGHLRPAITWGHNKDHRPDLKQLLFTLTLANDGGVPVYFSIDSGNTNDDTTHQGTWDVLRQLVGSSDFLYVADCKLASRENLLHIASQNGRFITVLPASRKEDREFRRRLRSQPDTVVWKPCWDRLDETQVSHGKHDDRPPKIVDELRSCGQESVTSDGFRLIWYHSVRKSEQDAARRSQQTQRAIQDLEELQRRLLLPRTRLRDRAAVQQAVDGILADREVADLLLVELQETVEETFQQRGRGRPSKKTRYQRKTKSRFALSWRLDEAGWREAGLDDGVFPLLTNADLLSPREILEAYKRQPKIEKRFSQLKSDFDIAPVFLKTPERVLGLLTVYFLALLVQSLIERELRAALAKSGSVAESASEDESIDIYPEDRRTRRPTARRVLDAFASLRRYEVTSCDTFGAPPQEFFDELTDTQKRLLKLLNIPQAPYNL